MTVAFRPIPRQERLKLALARAKMLAVRAARAEAELRPTTAG
jgi:hypothetical protein